MYDSYSATNDALYTVFGAMFGTIGIIGLVIGILTIVALWKLFQKAGKPGWASIVPFYNMYCLCDITFGNGWMFLLCLIPCVNVVVYIMLCMKLSKAFGQGTGFAIGLLFLNTIFILILGFGNYTYTGPVNNSNTSTY